jgi:uncharacterized Zn-finger protein
MIQRVGASDPGDPETGDDDMATATQSKPATFKGLALSCPMCGSTDARITLELTEGDPGEVTCQDCGESFTPAEAVELMAAKLAEWRKVARLVEMLAGDDE